MKTALVFAGQGAHRKGMGMNLITSGRTPAWRVWTRAQQGLAAAHAGFDLTTIIRDDPDRVTIDGETLRHGAGVLRHTQLTQPALLTVQAALYEEMKGVLEAGAADGASCVAGHSLGEFSALVAVGLLPVEAAAELAYQRGRIMVGCLKDADDRRLDYVLVAANPARAELSADQFAVLVELVARRLCAAVPHALLEVVNYNVAAQQLVVAGDRVAMSALGKAVDPQWRAIAVDAGADSLERVAAKACDEALRDVGDDVPSDPNAAPEPMHVPGARFTLEGGVERRVHKRAVGRRPLVTMDDGLTLPEEQLGHLSGDGDGRSGLKRKSWFMPLKDLRVPFHSSALRRGMDLLHPLALAALPGAGRVDAVTRRTAFVTNLTGTRFDADSKQFRADALEAVQSLNVGEQAHAGRFTPVVTEALEGACAAGDSRELLAAVVTAQLAHAVQWDDVMRCVVAEERCARVIEVSPTPTLTDMFRKHCAAAGAAEPQLFCYPRDAAKLPQRAAESA
jgi:malonyl CoA-acyl carrier protein transacylase